MIQIFFDGLCEPRNPGGIATYAYVIKNPEGQVLESGYGLAAEPYSSMSTNNVAEYTGLLCALRRGLEHDREGIVMGDSALVIKQMKGEYRIRSRKLIPLHAAAKRLMGMYRRIELRWIPREMNSEADSLTRLAYGLALDGRLKYVDVFEACDIKTVKLA